MSTVLFSGWKYFLFQPFGSDLSLHITFRLSIFNIFSVNGPNGPNYVSLNSNQLFHSRLHKTPFLSMCASKMRVCACMCVCLVPPLTDCSTSRAKWGSSSLASFSWTLVSLINIKTNTCSWKRSCLFSSVPSLCVRCLAVYSVCVCVLWIRADGWFKLFFQLWLHLRNRQQLPQNFWRE